MLGSDRLISVEESVEMFDTVVEVEIEAFDDVRFNTASGEIPSGTPVTLQDDMAYARFWPVRLSVLQYFKTSDPTIDAFVIADLADTETDNNDNPHIGDVGARGIAFLESVNPAEGNLATDPTYILLHSLSESLSTEQRSYSVALVGKWYAYAGNEIVDTSSSEVSDRETTIERIQTAVP